MPATRITATDLSHTTRRDVPWSNTARDSIFSIWFQTGRLCQHLLLNCTILYFGGAARDGHPVHPPARCENCRIPVILEFVAERGLNDVGGTPGGLGKFLIGFVMTCVGGYLLTNQVTVAGSYWNFYGASTFGVTLIPMLFGIGLLFWN